MTSGYMSGHTGQLSGGHTPPYKGVSACRVRSFRVRESGIRRLTAESRFCSTGSAHSSATNICAVESSTSRVFPTRQCVRSTPFKTLASLRIRRILIWRLQRRAVTVSLRNRNATTQLQGNARNRRHLVRFRVLFWHTVSGPCAAAAISAFISGSGAR
jgi:hypothetical protein